jgi:hypothetical protein
MVIYKGVQFLDGSENAEKLARADFDLLRTDEGAVKASLSLTGYKTVTTTEPNVAELQGPATGEWTGPA